MDPLRPLVVVVRTLSTLVITLILLGGMAAISGSGSVLNLGGDDVCAPLAGGEIPIGSVDSDDEAAENRRFGLEPGVYRVHDVSELCQEHPDLVVRTLGFLSVAPDFGLLLGFSGGVWLLVRRAQRHGLFSRSVANAVHGLGWWVLGGALVVATVQALADSALVGRMRPSHHWFDALGHWHTSVSGLLAGVGLLTIARVMRIAVDMRAELDATI